MADPKDPIVVASIPLDTPKVASTSTGLPEPSTLADMVDADAATFLPALKTKQTAYAAAHGGRYFQLLRTHKADPVDGTDTDADTLTTRPYYQAESASDFGIATWKKPYSMAITQYRGPDGRGWEATLSFKTAAGDTYRRSKNWGPASEDYRTQNWTKVSNISP